MELGLVAPDTVLPPRNSEPGNDVTPWDELSDGQRTLAARYMEVYAAMVDNIDQNVGRLVEALEAMGELDNTIFVFTSDNGASREGEVDGTASYYVHLMNETDVEADLARLDEMGGPTTTPHYPRGWAMAGNTPFRLYKINAHAGGHQVPLILHGPVPGGAGELRRPYQHVTDLLPTLLELCEVAHPAEAGDASVRAPHGTSFLPVLADAAHPSTHPEQYTEMIGQRGFRLGDLEAVTLHQPLTPFDEAEWELYDMAADPTQVHDLAREQPEVLADLIARWEEAAWANQVYPLDEGSQIKYLIRPPHQAVYEGPVTLLPGTPTLERWRSLQLLFLRSVTITIRAVVGPDDEGILLAHGDQGAGYAVWLDAEGLHLAHNDGCGVMRQIDGPAPRARGAGAHRRAPGARRRGVGRPAPHRRRSWWTPRPAGPASTAWPPSRASTSASTGAHRWCGACTRPTGATPTPATSRRSPTSPATARRTRRPTSWTCSATWAAPSSSDPASGDQRSLRSAGRAPVERRCSSARTAVSRSWGARRRGCPCRGRAPWGGRGPARR